MNASEISKVSDIVITIIGILAPMVAGWLLKKIGDKDRRELVRQTAVHAFKFISDLPQVKDNPNLDAMGLVLARVSEQLGGLSLKEESFVKAVAESAHINPDLPQRLPRFSPSIQLPAAKLK